MNDRGVYTIAELKTPIEIMKLLDGSNCRECGFPTCLAFATEVFHGRKQLSDCPKLDTETIGEHSVTSPQDTIEKQIERVMNELKEQIAAIDLEEAAKRLGAPYSNNRINIRCLGKNFFVDKEGNIQTDIHVNPWIAGPVFNYILYSAGLDPTGEWTALRDLPGGQALEPLYIKRCEEPCKQVADSNPAFFDDLIRIFNGKQVENHYKSDTSLVLHPLPKVPLLICYWEPDGEIESELNLFFDSTADRNLPIDSIFRLCGGLATMFQKIALKHNPA